MNPTLEPEELRQRIEWMRDRHIQAIERVFSSAQWGLNQAKRDFENYGEVTHVDNHLGRIHTHSDNASNITRTLLQTVSNLGLAELVKTAADLDEAERMLVAYESFVAGLPDELRAEVEAIDRDRQTLKENAAKIAAAARQAKDDAQCHFRTYDGRCARKGKVEIDGQLYCKQHADRIAKVKERGHA